MLAFSKVMTSELGNMTPAFIDNVPSRHSADTEPAPKLGVRYTLSSLFTQFSNISLCQLSPRTIFTECRRYMTSSALLNTILHVVFVRSKEQVKGIVARWIVALVANFKLQRVNTVMQVVGNAVRSPESVVRKELTVTVGALLPEPWPALILLACENVGPEDFKVTFVELRKWSKLELGHVGLSNRLMCLGSDVLTHADPSF